jgi:hypothetical protein
MKKRLIIAIVALVLLLVGAGTTRAFSDTTAPAAKAAGPVAKPHGTIGTKNTAIKREYNPLATPCRLYDSRHATKLTNNTLRTIPLTACPGISVFADALNVSLSTVSPSGTGYLHAFANGTPEPNQTVLQWGTTPITTGATVTMSSSGVRLHSFGGATHIVIDVAGYYTEPIYADILTASTTAFADMYSSTKMISGYSSALASPGQIVISVRRDVLYCDIQATAETPGYIATAVYYNSQSILVRITDSNGNWVRAYASVTVNC